MDRELTRLDRDAALDPDDREARGRVLRALERREREDERLRVEGCLRGLRSRDRRVVRVAEGEAKELGLRLRPELERRLRLGRSQRDRRWALEVMWRWGLVDVEVLLEASRDEAGPVRAYAANLLGRQRGEEGCRDRLVEMLGDGTRYVREAAIRSLGWVYGRGGDPVIREVLTGLLEDPSGPIREVATEALLGS